MVWNIFSLQKAHEPWGMNWISCCLPNHRFWLNDLFSNECISRHMIYHVAKTVQEWFWDYVQDISLLILRFLLKEPYEPHYPKSCHLWKTQYSGWKFIICCIYNTKHQQFFTSILCFLMLCRMEFLFAAIEFTSHLFHECK